MRRRRARLLGAAALAISASLLAAAAGSVPASGAPTVVIYDGDAEASALHVRATKESLLPVPDALDTFLPLARARVASPDSRFALASPAFDTNISNLPDLLCTASRNRFCPPDVPLTASVDEPGTADETPTPRIAAGPLVLGAGFAEARADPGGARATAREGELVLIPGGSAEASAPERAADVLRGALRTTAPTWEAAASDALVAATGVSAVAELTVGPDALTSSSTASVGGLSLLEGLIRVEALHSEASIGTDAEDPSGGPELTGVAVGPYEATIDEEGIHLADETLAGDAREALNAALAALDELVRIRLGGLRTEPQPDGTRVRSIGLRLSYEREVAPNTGAEVVEIEIGNAVAAVARSETAVGGAGTTVTAPPVPPAPVGDEPAPVAGSTSGSQGAPAPEPRPERIAELPGPETAPSSSTLPGLPDFPVGMLVLVLGAAVAAGVGVALLTGWQVAEE